MVAQRQRMESLFGAPVQRRKTEELPGDPETAQRVAAEASVSQRENSPGSPAPFAAPEPKPNNTGLPDGLKSGVESLSGLSLDNVKVHYNSPQPVQLNALAYAQGGDIHVAPGQEQHLPHEAWHVVQQAQGRVRPTMQMTEGVPVNDDAGLEHEADAMGAKAVGVGRDIPRRIAGGGLGEKAGLNFLGVSRATGACGAAIAAVTRGPVRDGVGSTVQRAIGLELEVAVPVDQLAANELAAIRAAAGNNPNNVPTMAPLNPLIQGGRKRAVPYSRDGIKASNGNFRVGIDHDPRVNTDKSPPFPYRDMNNSAIVEVITEPANDKAEFDTAMDDVDQFITDVNTHTNNLTSHAINPFGGASNANIGPIDYPALGPMPRESSHNWKASVQVNIGIDMREYASLAKWYAKSTYADPSKAEPHARGDYKRAKANITKSVDIGREVTAWIAKQITKQERTQMGNLRGLRGWITHMTLYMLGGKGGLPQGSTEKNITPILMKSPNDIVIHYGMTTEEKDIYLNANNRELILEKLIEKTGRGDLDPANPLAGEIVEGFPGGATLNELSGDIVNTLFAGQPIVGEQPVGPARTGATVPNTGAGDRGGAVVEFRNLPGFYQPNQWRQLGYDFLRRAENRNKRSGEKPNKLKNLQGNEWG